MIRSALVGLWLVSALACDGSSKSSVAPGPTAPPREAPIVTTAPPPPPEPLSDERALTLAAEAVIKMEQLATVAGDASGDCKKLAAALVAFRRDNRAFIDEMNGLEARLSPPQKQAAEVKYTAPMQAAMTKLLEKLLVCKDDPEVARAFAAIQP